jgi:hypothetical protein
MEEETEPQAGSPDPTAGSGGPRHAPDGPIRARQVRVRAESGLGVSIRMAPPLSLRFAGA